MTLLGCKHVSLSRVMTIGGHTYQACLDCGAELEYDLEAMRPTGRRFTHSPITHPDTVATARQRKPLAIAANERTSQW